TDTLDDLRWKNRLLIVLHTDSTSVALQQQTEWWRAEQEEADERELLLIAVEPGGTGTIGSESLRRPLVEEIAARFHRAGRDFEVVLVGKDGTEKERWQEPVPMGRVFALIDAMPMRRREMRERVGRGSGG
ncbi:MAG: DUF4174 domain-containing protein, partial [Rhodothermales bacterium]|nr:DUF4174 domain-containing protein [Rhodothermales bacterium]